MHVDASVGPVIQSAIPNFAMVRYLHTKTNCRCDAADLLAAHSHDRMDIFYYLRTHFPEVSLDSRGLFWVAINNDVDLFNVLRDEGSIKDVDLNFCEAAILNQNFEILEFGLIHCDSSYRYILEAAARELDWEAFRKVFHVIEKVHPKVKEGHFRNCTLKEMFRSRNTDLIRFLLTLSEDSEMFEEAARIGDLALVEFLSMHGSRDLSPGHYSFDIACFNGHLEVVKYLLDRYPKTCDVSSGLDYACWEGYPSVIGFLAPLVSEKGAQKARQRCSNRPYLLEFLESKLIK
jgi:hypothetical protein